MLGLRFALDERAEALAAGRREVLLAGVGAALLLVIGDRRARPAARHRAPRRARSRDRALLVAAGKPALPLGWRRRDAVGVLAGTLDALGGTMRALQARIDGLELKDPLTGVLNHRGLHDALHEALERRARPATRRSRWSCSTSTTSSSSTTPPAMPPATRRCGWPRA